jgi:acetoin utilization deacetylase AcuC-like enzyme
LACTLSRVFVLWLARHTGAAVQPRLTCSRLSSRTLVLVLGVCAQRPRRAYATELAQFHSEDYVDFLARVTPDTAHVRDAHRTCVWRAREDSSV